MSNNKLKETIGNEEMSEWLDRANNSVRKSVAVFEVILNECPNKKSNEFHHLNAVLLGRKVGALLDVASWFDGIDVEKIRKQNADLFNLKLADNSQNN
ncbi:MAG: hypothetical protein L3J59_07155 [Methylococcaceae bacterium]|nr:hypothetical protein [Methylococcaceae bacterium]